MAVFANIINSIIEATVSVGRLEDFLSADELDTNARKLVLPRNDPDGEPQVGDEVVSIKGGEFRWVASSTEPILQDIDLSVKKGDLVAVIGRVGDGKSSLLGSILGEMTRSEGSVKVRGDVAYFSQTSWILSATVKDNITFGHRFDQAFYDKVLDACALRADLAVLPSGDMTEVGEKGVSLSGGQKARICLARTCYARADVYLLDDPLSAVDAHVGRHIFDRVLGPNGLLKHKARVLCTNAVNFLPQADQVIMLRRGIILERGTYAEAMLNRSSELYKLITGLGKQSAKEESGAATPIVQIDDDSDEEHSVDDGGSVEKRHVIRRLSSGMRRASVISIKQAKRDALRDLRESAKPKEHSEKGSVKRHVYGQYIKAGSRLGVALFIVLMVTGQGAGILSNFTLRSWAGENSRTGESSNVSHYLLIYGLIGISSSIFSVGSMVVMRLYCGLRSSKYLHDRAFNALMRSPLSFFELTPTGRILNLFSRDVFVIDEVLIMSIAGIVRMTTMVLGTAVVIALGAPLVLLVFLPLGWLYRRVQV
jgi:ABC-type multidrug transport system fused ATPase/permease subunit